MSEFLGNMLKTLRKQKGLSQKEVCEQMKVKQSTFSSWENGVHEPSASMLLELCNLYGAGEAVSLLFGDTTENGDFILNEGESSIIKALRELPENITNPIKELVLNLGSYFENQRIIKKESTSNKIIKFISQPVFLMAASAGTGQFLDSDEYELIDFPEGAVPRESTFGVRVSGNSMEPDYKNGSIVFVKRTKHLNPGEVGIFVLNGEGYLKILGDNNTLKSINPDYDDIQIHEWDDCRLVGKVIGNYENN